MKKRILFLFGHWLHYEQKEHYTKRASEMDNYKVSWAVGLKIDDLKGKFDLIFFYPTPSEIPAKYAVEARYLDLYHRTDDMAQEIEKSLGPVKVK